MALTDIIQAINAQADKEISQIQQNALNEKNAIKRAADEEIAAYEADLKNQTEAKKAQLKKKAETHVMMDRRKKKLQTKRRAIDELYAEVAAKLAALPEEKMEKITKALEKKLGRSDGEKQTSKVGGFVFVTKNTEEDFTFPHLVESVLRPMTELDISAKLFS